ncbi:MAG: translation initiation factor IF-2 [Clostridia bacterium]|nr:translation initiation factor IF-2 [Clostridia bacterium]
MAQQNTNYRINRLAKDFNVKSKDILDLLGKYGIEGKTHMAVLEPSEFNLFLEVITVENQLDDLDSYVSGKTYIPRKAVTEKKKAADETPAAEKQVEVPVTPAKDENQEAPKKETANREKPKEKEKEIEKEKRENKSGAESKPKPETSGGEQKRAKENESERKRQQPQQQQQQPQRRPDGRQRSEERQQPQSAERRARDGRDGRESRDNKENVSRQKQAVGERAGERTNGQRRQQPQQQPQSQTGEVITGRGQVEAPKKNRGPWQPADGLSGEQKQKKKVVQGEARHRTGNTRIVDTKSGSVDLEKFNEHLTSYVSDRDDSVYTKQRNARQGSRAVGGKRRDKDRRKTDKLRKEEIERQRRSSLKITIPDEITVGELAGRLKISAPEVIKKLIANGVMATVNQTIDFDTAYLITEELGVAAEREVVVTIEEQLFDTTDDAEDSLVERSPVVCVMGHVDHGKTSLLDAIRHTNVTAGEAGGITQHIGAYRVSVGGKYITFLDTPGHEAFTAMRLRGAMATDIAIIVVAADDGIMPQTIEAINHAKAAGVQIIVAINKMDKPGAHPDSIMQELTKYDVVPEEWGGDVMCVPVSAVTKQGIDTLLEDILLIAEVEDYRANPARRAQGLVIEAKLDKGRGPVATVLVQNGTLKSGDIVIAGTSVGHVRSMTDETGRALKTAGPSVPVEITGLSEVPAAGDEFNAVEDEKMARELAEQRRSREKEEIFRANARASLNDMFAQIESGIKDFNIIVKADVKGSAEAVKQSLEKISNTEVKIVIIHSAVGGIIESDVQLAAASNAIIVGFNVRPNKASIDMAARLNVEIRTYRVIYECVEEMTAAMKGMLAPKFKEEILGHAEVRQTIHVPNVGMIAGSYVQDGKLLRGGDVRIVRDGVVIFEDKIASLRHFKEDRREIMQGYECGVGLERFSDIKEHDVFECFHMVEIEAE